VGCGVWGVGCGENKAASCLLPPTVISFIFVKMYYGWGEHLLEWRQLSRHKLGETHRYNIKASILIIFLPSFPLYPLWYYPHA